jgi:cytochrome d ubiquinol oxidase subunit I
MAAAWDTCPTCRDVLPVPRHGPLGFGFIAFFAIAFWRASACQFSSTWFLKLAVCMIPLPWLAIESGWVVAEIGRQPWAVDGVLPTFLGASSLTMPQIWTTIVGFTALYGTLAVIEVRLMLASIRKGPIEHAPDADHHDAGFARFRPNKERGDAYPLDYETCA